MSTGRSSTAGPGTGAEPIVVVMGVAGSGKTTVGRPLAAALRVPFLEGDDLHPAANRERMAAGRPLEDAHRWPWLDAVRARMAAAARAGTGLVVACSALKRSHRQRLAEGLPAVFVHLDAGREVLRQRLEGRGGHFFPAALLDSQLADLEPLEPPENGIAVDARRQPAELAASLAERLSPV